LVVYAGVAPRTGAWIETEVKEETHSKEVEEEFEKLQETAGRPV